MVCSINKLGEAKGGTHVITLISFLTLSVLLGCETTSIPSTDNTAPTLEWVLLYGGNTSTYSDGDTASLSIGDSATLFLNASDEGGVKSLSLSGAPGWVCREGDITERVGPGLARPIETTNSPNNEGEVPTGEVLNTDVGFDNPCDANQTFEGGGYEFDGVAEDFNGNSTTAELTVEVTP